MGQYFRVNGDYNIKTKDGGTIVLDPGTTGEVYVTGDLTVAGNTTSVSSVNLDIEDNIITLNKGETGAGVSLTYSGMEIDRGSSARAALVFDEDPLGLTGIAGSAGTWAIASTSVSGSNYAFGDSNLKLRRILTDADYPDLILIGTGTGVVKVRDDGGDGTAYFDNIADPNHIPNKYYVDYSILNNPTFQIRAPQSQDTRVIIADAQVTPNNSATGGSIAYYNNQLSGITTTSQSTIGFVVDGVLAANIYADRVQLQQLEFDQTEILTVGSGNANIKFTPYGTGKVEVNGWLQINNDTTPSIVYGSHVIYSSAENAGKSGLYFVNTENTRDELVSKNRALLFSMLF